MIIGWWKMQIEETKQIPQLGMPGGVQRSANDWIFPR